MPSLEDVNEPKRNFLSFPELGYGSWEFNSKESSPTFDKISELE